MKINFLILGVIIALTIGLTYWIQKKQTNNVGSTYDTAPNFSYKTLSGNEGTLANHRNKVVLVHFWATWCPPCIVEFPELLKLAASQKDTFVVLAISVDERKSDIQKFMAKQQKPLPDNFVIIQDAHKDIAEELFAVKKYPANFLLSPSLEIREILKGPEENWNSNKWQEKILNLAE